MQPTLDFFHVREVTYDIFSSNFAHGNACETMIGKSLQLVYHEQVKMKRNRLNFETLFKLQESFSFAV